MRVGGEVMMIPHGYTRCVHARRTLGALQIRSALVQHAHIPLHVRWTCVRSTLGVP